MNWVFYAPCTLQRFRWNELRSSTDVIVIGGGAVGAFISLDLALRGANVSLIERRGLASGASGNFHGVLHSGARYVVNDPVAATECATENRTLSKIASQLVVDTGGLFVAITEEDAEFLPALESGCKSCGVAYEEVPTDKLAHWEPNLNSSAKSAIKVGDKVIRGHDLVYCTALTASANGAKFYPYREVINFLKSEEGNVIGVKTFDRFRARTEEFRGKVIINAAGPWAGKLAKLAGVVVEEISFAGGMGVVPAKLCNHIVNRMRPPSDGDLMVPYGDNYCIMGTTATVIDEPDKVEVSQEDVDLLIEEGSQMFPALTDIGFRRTYAAVRPLLRLHGSDEQDARKMSRAFEVFDHKADGVNGLITVCGGKLTTCRLVAERAANLAAEKLAIHAPCRTKEVRLVGSSADEKTFQALETAGIERGLLERIMGSVGSVDEERFMPVIRLLLSRALAEDL